MGKLKVKHETFKTWFKNLNIKTAYIVYIVVALLVAAVVGLVLIFGINELRNYFYYTDSFKFEYTRVSTAYYKVIEGEFAEVIEGENGVEIRISHVQDNASTIMPILGAEPEDIRFSYDKDGNLKYFKYPLQDTIEISLIDLILVILLFITLPISFIIGCIVTSSLFFKYKLQPPLQVLMHASDKISDNELDFKITYENKDEMGQLCDSFEIMRQALYDNQKELWRNIEERKRLNSAFSHDLRTPLTVLKGYSEILLMSLESETINKDNMRQTITTMSNNIERLERYTYEMSRMQKLEDISVNKKQEATPVLLNHLKEAGKILSEGLIFNFESHINEVFLMLDLELIMQVYENLMANSKRYARAQIWVTCEFLNGELTIVVADDGPGFSAKGLENAMNPFYKEVENVDSAHFGLGLHICRLLTVKHGGHLSVANRIPSGAKLTANFGKLI